MKFCLQSLGMFFFVPTQLGCTPAENFYPSSHPKSSGCVIRQSHGVF